MIKIPVSGVIQAGDVFLLSFICPLCGSKEFEGYPLKSCSSCFEPLVNSELAFASKLDKRLLAGSSRKKRISKKIVKDLYEAQGRSCAYCYKSFEAEIYHVEHIIPICVGGTNDKRNLCLACAPCNLAAGPKVFNTFDLKRSFILAQRSACGANRP